MNKIVLIALLSLSTAVVGPFTFAASKPNVLFIAVDDLRPELGCYGVKEIKSPRIDQLAADGVRFDRAYTQVPVCGSARASLMTGLRPTATRFSGDYQARADKETPGVPDLAGWFKQHGYLTFGSGKIYHHKNDNAASWTAFGHPIITKPDFLDFKLKENFPTEGETGWGMSHEAADVPDEEYNQHQQATAAIERFKEIKASGQPGFVALGLTKPHLPFVAPKKYWDLYDRDAIPPSPNPFRSKGAPNQSVHNFGELRNYRDVPDGNTPVPPELVKTLRHGYYACVSFIDAQIGRVLDALEELGLRENTIVVLWSDHGFFLNDHAMWCKHALYSRAMRVPLIISAPGISRGAGSPALVELVDLFPTLCDLAGLPKPGHLEGSSMAPLLAQPDRPWKSAAFSRWFAGASIITDRYTYAEWPKGPRMLYDLQRDPFETENIADTPEGRAIADELSAKLAAGWQPVAAEIP
jgi:arylsulfatase A-like enzyme